MVRDEGSRKSRCGQEPIGKKCRRAAGSCWGSFTALPSVRLVFPDGTASQDRFQSRRSHAGRCGGPSRFGRQRAGPGPRARGAAAPRRSLWLSGGSLNNLLGVGRWRCAWAGCIARRRRRRQRQRAARRQRGAGGRARLRVHAPDPHDGERPGAQRARARHDHGQHGTEGPGQPRAAAHRCDECGARSGHRR